MQLGFKNYHALQLYLNEQDGRAAPQAVRRARRPDARAVPAAKAEIDARLAARLRHQASRADALALPRPVLPGDAGRLRRRPRRSPYAKADILKLCRKFYAGIGLPIDDVIARSDLYEKPGKSPHAFCTDIDREGDVRVLANIVPNDYWTATMLHEFGHSVYSSKNIPREPALRPAERVAHPDHRRRGHDVRAALARTPPGCEDGRRSVDDPKAFDETGAKTLRYQLLIFSRWCQVMLRFEKGMYENPDQDLNKLWWDLVEKYQMVQPARRPQRAGLRQQDPHRQRPGLLPQLHDGRVVRVAGAPRHRPRGLPRCRPGQGDLRRQQGRRRVHEREGLRTRPTLRLERADPARHRRDAQRQGVRRRVRTGVSPDQARERRSDGAQPTNLGRQPDPTG